MPKLNHLRPSSLSSNPRASLSSYLRFRDTIESAASGHPLPHVCIPSSLAPSTFISRIRDAVSGLLAFDYPCSVDKDRLSLWWSEVVVAPDPTNPKAVIIGPKTSVVEKVNAPTPIPQGMMSFTTLVQDEFDAFCLLLSRGRIQGPVHVKDGGWSYATAPNVEVLRRPDGSIVLI
jgi:hypothetical protein